MAISLSSPRAIRIRDVFPEANLLCGYDLCVESVCSDSRRVEPGDLFVAIAGTQHDGHDHVAEAINHGATAILAEQVVPAGQVPVCLVPDTRQAYGILCQALSRNPSHELRVVGITGTNGKTTTAALMASVLRQAGYRCATMGTLGWSDGLESSPTSHTTPPAPVLANWLDRAAANDCSHAVMEVSSHALSQSRIAGIELDAAIVTNVGRDHLDYHSTVDNYRRTKARLIEHVSPDGVVILNADDPTCVRMLSTLHHPVLTYGMETEAEVTATVTERHFGEQTFLISAGSETAAVGARMIGAHHISNCLAATALGLIYGISLPDIAKGLEAVTGVAGRMEAIACGQPFSVVVDYAHTPDALAACLRALREVTPGRLICVFGAGGDRDRVKRPEMGAVAERLADVAVLTSDNPRSEDPRLILADIRRGFTRPSAAHTIVDRAEAIAFAMDQATEGDCVVLAGKGHETCQIIGRERYYFDDRMVARDLLRSRFQPQLYAA